MEIGCGAWWQTQHTSVTGLQALSHVQVEARWAQQQLGRQWEAPEEGPGDEQGGGGGEGDDAGLQEEPALQVGASEELRQAGASRHDASEL
jgi:hypothetical protein